MITRGYIIGEIVDGLSTISHQVSTRCQLGLTDLNRYLEDFFKEFLNEAFSYNLRNLNEQRSNEPGLDLGDSLGSIGFQITSTKTSTKINNTLEKIIDNELSYSKVIVLIIGKKQTSYSINELQASALNFTTDDIWDIDDLCKQTVSLPLEKLNALYKRIQSDLTRIRIDLEIPDADGNYATSLDSYVERIPKPQLSTFTAYNTYHSKRVSEYEYTASEDKEHFKELSDRLSNLPRITREFYAFLLERREKDEKQIPMSMSTESVVFNIDKLERVCKIPDLKGELNILDKAGLVDPHWEADDNLYFVRIFALPKVNGFIFELIDYIEENNISYKKPIVSLDFSDF